jgi:hypothetical protein
VAHCCCTDFSFKTLDNARMHKALAAWGSTAHVGQLVNTLETFNHSSAGALAGPQPPQEANACGPMPDGALPARGSPQQALQHGPRDAGRLRVHPRPDDLPRQGAAQRECGNMQKLEVVLLCSCCCEGTIFRLPGTSHSQPGHPRVTGCCQQQPTCLIVPTLTATSAPRQLALYTSPNPPRPSSLPSLMPRSDSGICGVGRRIQMRHRHPDSN